MYETTLLSKYKLCFEICTTSEFSEHLKCADFLINLHEARRQALRCIFATTSRARILCFLYIFQCFSLFHPILRDGALLKNKEERKHLQRRALRFENEIHFEFLKQNSLNIWQKIGLANSGHYLAEEALYDELPAFLDNLLRGEPAPVKKITPKGLAVTASMEIVSIPQVRGVPCQLRHQRRGRCRRVRIGGGCVGGWMVGGAGS